LREDQAGKGRFDIALEASGTATALRAALPVVRPKGVVVLIGNTGEAALPMMTVVSKELELRGTFRFGAEFATAARFIADGLIDVRPLLTDVLPLRDATRAFELAADKSRAIKVQLSFD
jgi:L-idonate 5-dehydrogenase